MHKNRKHFQKQLRILKKLRKKLFHARNILLITNRGSDNCGDQVMEACDISLIRTIMKNLHVPFFSYIIESRDAGLVSRRYLRYRRKSDLREAERTIAHSDLVLFGGAPMFNYLYQVFYERTSIMIDVACKYNRPVIFSAIGIEAYDASNPKCRRITEAVNRSVVKSITTRDDFESLLLMKQRDDLIIGHVPDPAVFARKVFRKFDHHSDHGRVLSRHDDYSRVLSRHKDHTFALDSKDKLCDVAYQQGEMYENADSWNIEENKSKHREKRCRKKKVGVFVIRGHAFCDNHIPFSQEDVIRLYREIRQELIDRGYDYIFMTSGHFADEAFLNLLSDKCHIPFSKCIFYTESPEQLYSEISCCDAIISSRLHPSIIAYSCLIPSVGIVWNQKVSRFYDSIGYQSRVLATENITGKAVVDRIEKAMSEGVKHDTAYMYSLYKNLFDEFKNVFKPGSKVRPWTFEKVCTKCVPYRGTRLPEMKKKMERKFKRIYIKYNKNSLKLDELKTDKAKTVDAKLV